MEGLHDQLDFGTVIGIGTALFLIGIVILRVAHGTKHGVAIATVLAPMVMGAASFLWSMDKSGDYTRFRYGFPHFLAVKNYDFDHEKPMTPLKFHFDYALSNLWFWFGVCIFAVSLFKLMTRRRKSR